MKIPPAYFLIRCVFIGLFGQLAAAPSLFSAELVNDPFTDASRSNTTGGDTLGGVWWLDASNTGQATIVDDSAEIGSGNAMQFAPPGDFRKMLTFFSSTTLAASGDTIRVAFDYRFPTAPPSITSGFRVGLYNSNGTKQTSDTGGTTRNDDNGYLFYTNAGFTGTTSTTVGLESLGDDILGGAGQTALTASAGGASVISGTVKHSAVFQITRLTNGDLSVLAQIDGLAAASGTHAAASVLTYSFEEFAIGYGGSSNHPAILIDNVKITTLSISTLNVTASVSTATEGGASGTFTFTRTSGTGALDVNYTLGGTAVNGLDYPALSGTVNFADGETSKDVIVSPVADYYVDPSNTVIVTLAANANYLIGASNTATITITDTTNTPVENFPKTGITSCYNIVNSSSGFYTKSFVSVSGQSFSQAMHVVTTTGAASPYDGGYGPQIWANLAPAIAVNDVIVGTFWARSLNADGSHAWAGVKIADGTDTLSAGFGNIAPGPNWQKYTIFYKSGDAFAAGAARLKFFVGYGPMTIEIGGISLLNYGQVSPDSLGMPLYDGQPANAPWRTAAAARIEQYRKANFNVTVRDAAGNPLPGASVRAKMKRHAFGFGTAINSTTLTTDSANNQTYRNKVKQLFNWTVGEGAWKWKGIEANPTLPVTTLTWLNDNGVAKVRGHNLIWPNFGNMPADVKTTYDSTLASSGATAAADWLRSRILTHITSETSAFAGKMSCWDVINEPFSNHEAMDVLGRAEMAAWFNNSKAADPGTQMFLNQDYAIMGDAMPMIYSTINTINEIRANGATVDGIGLESHLGLTEMASMDRIKEVLDMWAAMGLRIQVTEFDLDSSVGQQCQADFLRDYMTICFSHPGVDAFTQWGFWAGAHWKPDRALYNSDWTIRPNGQAFIDQVFTQWWTDTTSTTDADGQVTIRGFKGDYDLIVASGSATATMSFFSGAGDVTTTITPRLPVTTTLNPIADAYVQDGASAPTNFGTNALLISKNSTSAGFNRDSYLKFILPALSPVGSVKLRVRAALGGAQSYGIGTSACSVSDVTWTESGVNWNNKPTRGAVLDNAEITSTTAQWAEFDVTSYVRSGQAAGRNTIALALHNGIATGGTTLNIDARESTNAPQLVITSPLPEAHLQHLAIGGALLSPPFDGNSSSYTTTVDNNVTSIAVTPTALDLTAAIAVNAIPVASGATSGAVNLNVGTNTVPVVVTAADGFTTQTYSVTVTRRSPVESWRQLYFGSSGNTGNAADLFDFDKDGLVNLVEFAFGLNPTQTSSMQLPQPERSAGNFVVSFTQPAGVSGITYGAEWCSTLSSNPADWTLIPDSDPSPTGYTFSVPTGANTKMFMRFRITSP